MLSSIAKPFGWLLMFLYELVANYGVAVILFAIVVKVILLPFQMKSKRGTMQSTRLQPQMAELQKRHGANKQKYNEEIQKLYKEEGVNPASGCIWGILPLPILLALYQAIRFPLTIMMGVSEELLGKTGAIAKMLSKFPDFTQTVTDAYVQIEQTQFISKHFDAFSGITDKLRQIDYSFLGIDLGAVPSFKIWAYDWAGGSAKWGPQVLLFLVPLVAGGLSLAQSLILKKYQPQPVQAADGSATAGSMKMMTYLMPLMSVYFAFIMPAALGIYWAVSSVLQIVQEVVLTKHYTKKMDAEAEIRNRDRALRDAEIERKREETEQLKAENRTELNKSTSKKKLEAAEKTEREAKAAAWAKNHTPPKEETEEPSRSGNRQYARGRAYMEDRYGPLDDEPVSESDEAEYETEEQDSTEAVTAQELTDTEYADTTTAEDAGAANEAEAAEIADEDDSADDDA